MAVCIRCQAEGELMEGDMCPECFARERRLSEAAMVREVEKQNRWAIELNRWLIDTFSRGGR